MRNHQWVPALLLIATFTYVVARPAPASEVEVIPSQEISTPKKQPPFTLKDTEDKQFISLTDLTDEGIVQDHTVEDHPVEDDRGKRMLAYVQTILNSILQPQPIVDTITEEEKYGNTGDTLGAVGRGIVGGSEAISNFINLAIDYPRNMFKSLVHRVTDALNHVGSKLVGL